MDGQSDSPRDLLKLLLGSTYEYVGDEPDRLSIPRLANLLRIVTVALRRLGPRVSEPGGLPPRAIECLLGPGSFVDQSLSADYWGGVLASARTRNPDDDRGLRWLKLLERLTNQQIRTHYLCYATLRELCRAAFGRRSFDFDAKRYRLAVFLPLPGYMAGMGYEAGERRFIGPLVGDALMGLSQEILLDGSNTGTESYLQAFFKSPVIHGEGIVFAPSIPGVNLILWAFGHGDKHPLHFLDDGFDCRVEVAAEMVSGAAFVYDD